MKKPEEQYIVFLDFETTGSNPYVHFPIQIGAVLVDEELSIKQTFSSFIRPPRQARSTDIAFRIHQIDLDNLKDAPHPRDVIERCFERLGTNYRFASWNISFDVSFFRKLCNDNNKIELFNRINYRHIDIQTICSFARELDLIDPNVRSLDDCITKFKLKRSKSHDALEDSVLALEVYKTLLVVAKSACYLKTASIR